MKKTFLILMLVGGSIGLFAQQPPKLTLHADIGACRTYLNYFDAYANLYQKNHLTAGLGASLKLKLGYAVSFDPEIGVGGYGMTYLYHNSKSVYTVDSRLLLGYGQVSPMLTVGRKVGVAVGFSVMASCFTLGELTVVTRYNGLSSHTYKDHFGTLRNPVIWGPRISVQAMFPTKSGHAIGFRIGSFLNLNTVYQKYAYTDINPRFVQVFAGISYSPAARK
jgi:hypothetical protein